MTLVINEGAIYEGELVMDGAQGQGGSPRSLRSSRTPTASATSQAEGQAGQGAAGNTFIRRFGGQESAWDTPAAESTDDEPGP